MSARVTVIGAGIAGLATAVALRGAGHHVTVVEQRTDAAGGAGISIWPNALAALDEIGLGDAVRAAGGRVTAGAIRWRDGNWLRRPSPERIVHALGEPLVVVRRSVLTDILRRALPAGTVETGTATGLVITGSTVQITLADSPTREADAVIGADGVNSMVARILNGPLRSRYVGYTAWRGIAACPLDPALAGETMGAGTEVGHVPLGPDHTYWFATERAREGSSAPGGEHAYLIAKLASWAEPIPQLIASTDPADLLRNDLFDRAQPERWASGPAVIVGDAAHPMRPHLGQGGCQGLEDAAILARFIELSPDLPSAFQSFGEFRKRRVRPLVRESAMIGRIVNLRPSILSGAASRASALIPERAVTSHLASIAAGSAFVLPTATDVAV
ncbi:FAD-dependent oxidoreductase [Mycolicibacterium sp. CR10]|uniref:FAD-dependent oxidoreductase n=1 Tax=Mycolicibacterium sp. CR10 TaxID=2562314 RepID=UPI0010BFD129|nr:FAD-dependent oxidoreductase [Mycolicibacterium sp. CR10]